MGDVIQIEEVRLEQINKGVCFHSHLCFDEHNEFIECKDCGLPVSPFQAFIILVRNYNQAVERFRRREQELEDLEKRRERGLLVATKKVDEAWRRKNMVPVCPHCKEAIFPDDGFGGHSIHRRIAEGRRSARDPLLFA